MYYVALLQGSKMSASLHSSNLILGIECFRIPAMDVSLWPEGYDIRVRLRKSEIVSRKGQNIYLLFNYDIVKYLLRTNSGGEKENLICYFRSLKRFNYRGVDGSGVEYKVLFRAG